MAKKKEGKKPTPKGYSWHHLIPKSRGGNYGKLNLVLKRIRYHEAFHLLFGNRTPDEVLLEIIKAWAPKGYFKSVTIEKKDGSVISYKS